MNNYYDDSDLAAKCGYKVVEDPTIVSEGVCVVDSGVTVGSISDLAHGDAQRSVSTLNLKNISQTQFCIKEPNYHASVEIHWKDSGEFKDALQSIISYLESYLDVEV